MDGKVLNDEQLNNEIAKRDPKMGTMVEAGGPKSGPMQEAKQKTGKYDIRNTVKNHESGDQWSTKLSIDETQSYIRYLQGQSNEISQWITMLLKAEIKGLVIDLRKLYKGKSMRFHKVVPRC